MVVWVHGRGSDLVFRWWLGLGFGLEIGVGKVDEA